MLYEVITIVANLQALSDMKEQNTTAERVFGSSPPMNYLLYALNPAKMIGLNFAAKNPFNGATPRYVNDTFLSLPVIGSFHGSGKQINLETLIAARPDLVLIWEDDMLVKTVSEQIAKLGVPTLVVPFRQIDRITSYNVCYTKLLRRSRHTKPRTCWNY